jgi:hypothetical protein
MDLHTYGDMSTCEHMRRSVASPVYSGDGAGVYSEDGPGVYSGDWPGVYSGDGPGVFSGDGPGVYSGDGETAPVPSMQTEIDHVEVRREEGEGDTLVKKEEKGGMLVKKEDDKKMRNDVMDRLSEEERKIRSKIDEVEAKLE